MNQEKIDQLKNKLNASSYVVFFGGAGVSTESDIPDFRSSGGLYKKDYTYPAETMLSHSFFMCHMEEFYSFYRENMIFPQAKPNAAHKSLKKMEDQGILKAVITQNIDNLHQEAGSKSVLELHGSVHRNFCMDCRMPYDVHYVMNHRPIPKCTCGGVVKPDVVLYEESLDASVMNQAAQYIANADMLIVGGTSLAVYPAASLIHHFKGKNLVVINKEKTGGDHLASLIINDNIGGVLEKVVK